MADLNPRAGDILLAAVQIDSPAARRKYLEDACGPDEALLRQVEVLLQAQGPDPRTRSHPGDPGTDGGGAPRDEAGSLSEQSTQERPANPDFTGTYAPERGVSSFPHPRTERPGQQVGPYKLLQQLGEGGMGEVWAAEQSQPVRRRVALKLIKAGLDSGIILRRFEAERQALALMDHQNIAKVLDAGATPGGRPYFAMELIKGVPITRYCDQEHLSLRERLELVLPVCQAVQHAHQKGIIHRDLKPSNVLVKLLDGKPVPKVIDFGVAKATSQKLTDGTMYTEVGQIVGTLEYMAPEQAEPSNLDIDTRADIYSLGVILYELLTGSTPFTSRLRQASFLEALRIIGEDEPPPPSARLSASESLPQVAANRKTEPGRLRRLVRGDLDWLVMKALEKDRARRYPTANDLALDLQRYLRDEPVLAGAPGAGYRLRKFVRRHRGPVTAAVLVLLALLQGIAGTVYGLVRAEQQRKEAEQARRDAEEQARRADANLAAARRAVEDTLTAVAEDPQLKAGSFQKLRKDLLGKAVPFFEEFVRQQHDDPQLEAERGRAYDRLGFVRHEMGELAESTAAYARMVEVFTALAESHPDHPDYRLGLAKGHNGRSSVLANEKSREAEEAARAAVAVCRTLADEHPDVPEYRAELATGYTNLGAAQSFQGRYADAEAAQRQAVQTLQELVAGISATPGHRFDLARAQAQLGYVLTQQGKLEEGEVVYRRSLELTEQLLATDPGSRAFQAWLQQVLFRMSGVLQTRGKLSEAAQALDRTRPAMEKMVADYPAVPQYRRNLGLFHRQVAAIEAARGKKSRAEAEYRRAVAVFAKLAEDYPGVFNYRILTALHRVQLTEMLVQQGKGAEAEEQGRLALEQIDKLTSERPAEIDLLANKAIGLGLLAAVRSRQGQDAEAEAELRRALAVEDKLPAAGQALASAQSETAWLRGQLALVLALRGRGEEAEHEYRAVLKAREKLAAESPDEAEFQDGLAALLASCPVAKLRDPARAVPRGRIAVQLSPESPDYHDTLGIALYRSGEWQAAADALEEGLKLREPDDPGSATARLFQAMAAQKHGKPEEARRLLASVREALSKRGPSPEERLYLSEAAALIEGSSPKKP